MRIRRIGLVTMLSGAVLAGDGHAACNLIPSATQSFRGALGTANKPFAAPGDFVEVRVRPNGCDVASAGLGAAASQHVVTVVFTPPSNGVRRVAFLAADCSSPGSISRKAGCESVVGSGNVACVDGSDANLQLVTRNSIPHLSFRFPDTDALFAPDADDRTLSGPAKIAVTDVDANPSAPLPCGLATASCKTQSGLVACLDELYAADGTCQPNLEPTFPHFTALPVPNDYAAVCFKDSPVPCNPVPMTGETRYTVDAFGNLLMPFNWQGVLVDQGGVPVPRLMQATIRSPIPVPTPPAVNLGSFTPEGAPLPPIFEPNADPSTVDPNVLSIFGSVDAAYTILRLARRAGECACGTNTGEPCVLNSDCADPGNQCAPEQVRCPTACVGGAAAGNVCASNADCTGGKCGVLFPDFRLLGKPGGPIVLARQIPNADAICQLEPHASCDADADCTGTGDPCVSYALEANVPVPLESLTSGSDGVFAFTVNESVAIRDLNGDDDQADSVVTLRDRETGAEQPLGGQTGCNLAPTPVGRAVVRQQQPPFSFPAVETEGDVVAFLESEAATTPTQTPATYDPGCDQNDDDDDRDTILRAFKLGPTSLVPDLNGRPRAVDGALVIDGRSLGLSNGQLFFRTAEWNAPESTVRAGTHTVNFSNEPPSISADGRAVAFDSQDDLLPADTNGTWDVYVRDLVTNALELVSATPGGTAGNAHSRYPTISADGRWVLFNSAANDIVPGTALPALFLRDRCVSYGATVSGCTPTTTDVGLTYTGGQPTGGSGFSRASVSADGRFIAYCSEHTNLVADDTMSCGGFGMHPGSCPDVFVRDRCISNGVAVSPCSPTTEMVSRASNGTPGNGISDCFNAPAISDDGNIVAFFSSSTNFDPPLPYNIFARDRRRGTTTRVSESADGVAASGFKLRVAMSADGRYVAFENQDTSLIPGLSGRQQILVKDRLTGALEVASRNPGGIEGDDHSWAPAMSRDGRRLAYASHSSDLVPGDTNTCGVNTTPGHCPDYFVFDRATGINTRVNVAPDGSQTSGDLTCDGTSTFCGFVAIADHKVAFTSNADTLLGPGNDTNLLSDTFVRALDAGAVASHDLSGDGDADDTVLQTLDTSATTPSVDTLCPAGRTSVAAGMAAFLRPEQADDATGCPTGPLVPPVTGKPDLDGDGDVADEVVHLWRGGASNVENLHCAATAVKLSPTLVAALVDEFAQGSVSLNGDSDAADQVVKVYRLADTAPIGCADWQSTGRAADTVEICGSRVAFLASECGQGGGGETDGCPGGGTDFNADGDAADRVLQIWNPATSTLTNTQRAAEDFVCNDSLVAFRTRETAQCPGGVGCASGLNGPVDVDLGDDVLQVWDLDANTPLNSQRAVRPCRFSACDPRLPYRVLAGSVKFLTLECEQGDNNPGTCDPAVGTDLNGDGDTGDLVISVLDVQTAALTVLGDFSVANDGNPLQGGDTPEAPGGDDDGAVYQTKGRCLEVLGGSCTTSADCNDPGAFCEAGTCKKEHRTCTTTADCPPGVTCDRTSPGSGTTPASPDTDGDGVPDHLDNCVAVANGNQADLDDDGVGDLCDLATCGDGTLEYDEQCDGANDGACTGGCLANCTCATCATAITDSRAKVAVTTRRQAGKLAVRALLPLATYDGEPVTVRLDDGNSAPIAIQGVGPLPPFGPRPGKWRFKTRALGVQKVEIRTDTRTGLHKVVVAAKGWFPTAAADDTAANTILTLTVGTQCFTREATVKTDD